MKLIIDIHEGLYEAYKGRPPMLGDEGLDMICQAIANGTPLPEGHGRLIDADALVSSLKEYKIAVYSEYDEGRNQMLAWVCEDIVDAPTVIHADKKGEEE